MFDYFASFSPEDFFTLTNFLALFIGSFTGMLIGSLPGLGASVALVMLLPFTYRMEPITAILTLLSSYQSSNYGGSISSILLNIPGTPAAVATMLDGNTMARKGAPGKALAYSLYSSFVGGIFGGLLIIFSFKLMSNLALKLGAPELFLIASLGIGVAVTLNSKDVMKSILSVVFGIAISTIGIDIFTGVHRFTFGRYQLLDGIKMMSILIGVFAIPEIINTVSDDNIAEPVAIKGEGLRVRLTRKELKGSIKPTLIGSVIGGIGGIIPGIGSVSGTWIARAVAKQFSKTDKDLPFGEGNPEGISVCEAANNAGIGGELIPLLVFGFPANPAPAIIMGAFIIHGVTTGPSIFTDTPDLISAILIGYFFTSVVMLIMGRSLTPFFAKALLLPNRILVPILLILSVIGVYVSDRTVFDVWVAILIGVIAFILSRLDFSMPGFCLAFVLGPLIEENFRRSLMIYGDYSVFVTRPSCIFIIILTVIILILATKFRKGREESVSKTNS